MMGKNIVSDAVHASCSGHSPGRSIAVFGAHIVQLATDGYDPLVKPNRSMIALRSKFFGGA